MVVRQLTKSQNKNTFILTKNRQLKKENNDTATNIENRNPDILGAETKRKVLKNISE